MRMNPQARRKAGFTLVELLVVMVIIALLAGLIFAAGPGVVRLVRKQSVQNDIQQLKIAIMSYYTEYGRYPVSSELQGEDCLIGGDDGSAASTAEMMKVLMAEPEGWNVDHGLNPKRISFLSPRPAKGTTEHPKNGVAEDGGYYDMWGNEFKILLDTNYDDRILCTANSQFNYTDVEIMDDDGAFKASVMVLSVGEDETFGKKGEPNPVYKGSDDVPSWK